MKLKPDAPKKAWISVATGIICDANFVNGKSFWLCICYLKNLKKGFAYFKVACVILFLFRCPKHLTTDNAVHVAVISPILTAASPFNTEAGTWLHISPRLDFKKNNFVSVGSVHQRPDAIYFHEQINKDTN